MSHRLPVVHKQQSLFDTDTADRTMHSQSVLEVPLKNGHLIYMPDWLHHQQAYQLPTSKILFQQLQREVVWEQSDIVLYGKQMKIPRLNAWYGDPGCSYRYSGKHFTPLLWLPVLLNIKQALEKQLTSYLGSLSFNSALINYYRHGQDSVSWHSDDEAELGKNPVVASVSLGQDRVFQLRHRKDYQEKYQLLLRNGDLLVMYGETQHYWHHQIPKTSRQVGSRINITYRKVLLPE